MMMMMMKGGQQQADIQIVLFNRLKIAVYVNFEQFERDYIYYDTKLLSIYF